MRFTSCFLGRLTRNQLAVQAISLCALWMVSPLKASASELVFWHKEASTKDFLEKIIKEFATENKVSIRIEQIPVDDLKTALLRNVEGDKLPAAVILPADFVGLYKKIKLSQVPNEWINGKIPNDALGTVQTSGQTLGVPILNGNHIVLYYNKKFVKNPAKTWDELISQKSQIEKQGIKLIGWNYNEGYWIAGFLGAFGGWPLTNGKISLNTKSNQEALKFYKGLSDSGLVPKDCNYDCNAKRFFDGEFAYALNGDWAFSDMVKNLGDNLGVATIPSIGDKKVTPMFSTQALVFPGESLKGPHGEVLKKLSSFLISAKIQDRFATEANRIPVIKTGLETFKKISGPNQKMLLTQLETARAMPSDTAMAAAWEGLRQGWRRYVSGAVEVEKATELMQKTAEKEEKNIN